MGNWFVNIMILLQIGVIVTSAMDGKWALMIYWIACLTLNYVVTYEL